MTAHHALAGAPVVVGVDGSARGLVAVEMAVAEAALRRRALRIVHVFTLPPSGLAVTAGLSETALRACHDRAWQYLDDAVATAAKCAPDVPTTTELLSGPAAPMLLAESDGAHLLVLGDRGLGGLDLLVGSVAVHTATHARCPVLIVRGDPLPDGPVVAGVDGSPTSKLALDFAAEEASLRETGLVALHVWSGNDGTELNADLPMTTEFWGGEEEESRVLAEAMAGITERYPDLHVRRQVRHGSARRLLTDWSRTAQLVVVGSRGHGGFAGLLLGSVGQHLLHRAGCPTAVVRPVTAQ
jgi:nucleotide-binding universal stress UspA family protein